MLDPNPGSSGIKTVLNKLLDKRGGSLDDFPGRDLARNNVWKETNFTHFAGIVPHLRSRCSKNQGNSSKKSEARRRHPPNLGPPSNLDFKPRTQRFLSAFHARRFDFMRNHT
jgi:hypothetical protein